MIETLQLEEAVPAAVHHHEAPKLLVEWSSRWEEFRGAIKPALARSEARLAGEAPFGLVPFRIMIPSYVLEAFLILAAIFVKVKIDQLRPYVAPRFSPHDVIYYSGDELPRTEDLGGAQSGASGRAGGNEASHRTQTIKIARGGALVPKVVDAPNLKLPSSGLPVANLLAIRPNPGPPPTEGMRGARSAPSLAATVVAPAPNVIRDYTRNGVQLNSVIAPAPTVTRDHTLTAPSLNATLIAPPPAVSNDHTLVAPRLAPAVIPPAPRVTRDRTQAAPSLNTEVVAPAPKVSSDRLRSSQALAANVIPPAPGTVSREMSSAPVRMTDMNVVPPPVSAPERASSRSARLTMPAPAVVAPPPSDNVSGDMRRIPTGSAPDPSQAVVPPPPTPGGSGSFMSSLIGKIFGPTEVVPPPPSVNAASGDANGSRRGTGSSLSPNVVAPPPSVGAQAGTGTRASAAALGAPSVVPPPPSLSASGRNSAAQLAGNVVPPPPSIGGGSNAAGSGLGRKGVGLGAPLYAGSNVAPPANGGSGGAGAVVSTQPGPRVALPANGGTGSLALSPGGGDKAGLGGSGGGTGIGAGNGAGSGMNGSASGAGKTNVGRGSNPVARGGISPATGVGGAGNVPTGNPPAPGIDISGGTGIVNLPSFGSDPAGSSDSASPGRSAFKHGSELGVTIVATANSGGAFEPYKNLLRGEKYTTYISTSLGTVVMEFADEKTGVHAFGNTLTAPAAIRTDLAEGLPHARMVVTCRLDASGNVTNVHVLEAGPAAMTAKVVAALRSWKFQPAMRNNQPVEVTAILGFGIDTNDRF